MTALRSLAIAVLRLLGLLLCQRGFLAFSVPAENRAWFMVDFAVSYWLSLTKSLLPSS